MKRAFQNDVLAFIIVFTGLAPVTKLVSHLESFFVYCFCTHGYLACLKTSPAHLSLNRPGKVELFFLSLVYT